MGALWCQFKGPGKDGGCKLIAVTQKAGDLLLLQAPNSR
jgi:hypothetical protein